MTIFKWMKNMKTDASSYSFNYKFLWTGVKHSSDMLHIMFNFCLISDLNYQQLIFIWPNKSNLLLGTERLIASKVTVIYESQYQLSMCMIFDSDFRKFHYFFKGKKSYEWIKVIQHHLNWVFFSFILILFN